MMRVILILLLVQFLARSSVQALTAAEKQQWVELHNNARSVVVPTASDMVALVWDDTIAIVAQAYANKCMYGHNPNLGTLKYGENIAAGTGSFVRNASMQMWNDDEKPSYTYSTNTCAPGKVCGHYTQVVWAKSVRFGCGETFCPILTNAGKDWTFHVCDFSPP
jgi:hypothetical protein